MTYVIYPTRVEKDGSVVYQENGGDCTLKWAGMRTAPGEDVILHGMHERVAIAATPLGQRFELIREAPFDFRLKGATPADGIRGLDLGDSGGGIAHVGLRDLTIDGRGVLRVIMGEMGKYGGRLSYKRVTLRSNQNTQFGFRHNGSFELVYEDIDCPDGGQEWALYDDYHTGNILYRRVRARNWPRGMIQRVMRQWPNTKTVLARQDCAIENCTAINCGSAGASAVSLYGFWGITTVSGLNVDSSHKTSAIVAIFDNKQTELTDPGNQVPAERLPIIGPGFVNPEDLRAGGRLVIIDPDVNLPTSDRSVINCDSLRKLEIIRSRKDRSVRSNKWAVSLEENGAGKAQYYDKSIETFTMEGDFSDWQSQGYRRNGHTFSPVEYGGTV